MVDVICECSLDCLQTLAWSIPQPSVLPFGWFKADFGMSAMGHPSPNKRLVSGYADMELNLSGVLRFLFTDYYYILQQYIKEINQKVISSVSPAGTSGTCAL